MKVLKIQLPIGQTLAQAVLLVTVFLLILEGVARTTQVKNLLEKYEYFGSAHPQFDAQLINIRERAKKEGHIDCIIIGNSQVLYGIDPTLVEQTYFEKTDKKIVCQNFGLGGITFFSATAVINILVDTYQPSVIILGTSFFDYTALEPRPSDISIMSSPWVKYRLNEFILDGWLIEKSSAYRYYSGIDHYLFGPGAAYNDFQENGYIFRSSQSETSIEDQKEFFDTILPKPVALVETSISLFRSILNLQSDKMDILIVEVPVTTTVFNMRPRANKVHLEFTSLLNEEAGKFGVKVLFLQNILKIPENGWHDIYHLNSIGTSYLSRTIGEWLGEIGSYSH